VEDKPAQVDFGTQMAETTQEEWGIHTEGKGKAKQEDSNEGRFRRS